MLYNAVLADATAFDQAPAAVQQRVFDNDNANSMGPYSRQPPAPPVTCDQFRALHVPALVISAEKSRAISRVGSEMMAQCLATRVEDIPGGRATTGSRRYPKPARARSLRFSTSSRASNRCAARVFARGMTVVRRAQHGVE